MAWGRGSRGALWVALALIALFAITQVLAGAYRVERHKRAQEHFDEGQRLAAEGKPQQAAEEYRAALSFSNSDPDYALALSRALFALGSLNEAEAHLSELSESDPTNGEVNLMLARIAARQGRVDEAIADYQKAIYGLWAKNPVANRIQARLELIDLLAQRHQRQQVLAQLLEVAAQAPDDPTLKKQIAYKLLQYGSPAHAAEVYQDVLNKHPGDADAYVGLGDADFAVADYTGARNAFRRAVRGDPKDTAAWTRLQECNEILALDPGAMYISSRQRFRRSQELLKRCLDAANHCLQTSGKAAPVAYYDLVDAAQQLLAARRRREGDTPHALQLARQLWTLRGRLCGPAPESEEALGLVIEKVNKSDAEETTAGGLH